MKTQFSAIAVLLFFCGASGAAPNDVPTILSCDGVITNSGHNMPKDSLIIPSRNESATYTLAGNKLTSPNLVLSAETLSLCKETLTEYIYSTNCAASPRAFVRDWLAMTDAAIASQIMAKKYGEYSVVLETVSIDRVNLTLSDEHISPMVQAEYKKIAKGEKIQYGDALTRFFTFTNEFRGQCKIVKPQF